MGGRKIKGGRDEDEKRGKEKRERRREGRRIIAK